MSTARSWGLRHPTIVMGVRITAGTWNLFLGILLMSQGHQWAVVLLAVSAVIFGAAYVSARGKSGSRQHGHG